MTPVIRRGGWLWLMLAALVGCAGMETMKADLKTRGVEVDDGKVKRVFRF